MPFDDLWDGHGYQVALRSALADLIDRRRDTSMPPSERLTMDRLVHGLEAEIAARPKERSREWPVDNEETECIL